MKRPRDLELSLWECRALRSERDVVAVLELLAGAGLLAASGAWTREGGTPHPVDDLGAAVAGARWLTPSGERAARGGSVGIDRDLEVWTFPVVWPRRPRVFSNVSVARRVGDRWDVHLFVASSSHTDAGLPLDAFCAEWGPLLEGLGDALRDRAEPALGAITNTGDELVAFEAAVARRRLVVGWRTWYGPPYVEAFGRELLLGLPDGAGALEGGGVRHALDALALQVVQGDQGIFARVWPYVQDAGVELAWPRRPRDAGRRGASTETAGARLVAAASAVAAAAGAADEDQSEEEDHSVLRVTAFRHAAAGGEAAGRDQELAAFQSQVDQELGILPALPDTDGSCVVQLVPFEWSTFSEWQRDAAWPVVTRTIGDALVRYPRRPLRVEICDSHPDLAHRLEALARELPLVSHILIGDGPD